MGANRFFVLAVLHSRKATKSCCFFYVTLSHCYLTKTERKVYAKYFREAFITYSKATGQQQEKEKKERKKERKKKKQKSNVKVSKVLQVWLKTYSTRTKFFYIFG